MHARAAVLAALCIAAGGMLVPVSAQHAHHGVTAHDTLVVEAEQEAVRLRSGATVVEVRGSASAGSSIADLLRTVPGIELDPDGRISMRGSTSVLVLMNGRHIPLTGDALVAFLRQMPAAALERVQAGTNMSAREGADGAAGVVNLIFRDDVARRTGTRSVAGSIATEDHYMASVAATGYVSDVLKWDAMYSLWGCGRESPRGLLARVSYPAISLCIPMRTAAHVPDTVCIP